MDVVTTHLPNGEMQATISIDGSHPLFGINADGPITDDYMRYVLGICDCRFYIKKLVGGKLRLGKWEVQTDIVDADGLQDILARLDQMKACFDSTPYTRVYEQVCVLLEDMLKNSMGYAQYGTEIRCELPDYRICINYGKPDPLCMIFMRDEDDWFKIWEADRHEGVWKPWMGTLQGHTIL